MIAEKRSHESGFSAVNKNSSQYAFHTRTGEETVCAAVRTSLNVPFRIDSSEAFVGCEEKIYLSDRK